MANRTWILVSKDNHKPILEMNNSKVVLYSDKFKFVEGKSRGHVSMFDPYQSRSKQSLTDLNNTVHLTD